jgi:membrane fusion protein, multidrug efflux system
MDEVMRCRGPWRWLACNFGVACVVAVIGPRALADADQPMSTPPGCDRPCPLVEVVRVTDEEYAPRVALTGSIEPKFSSNIAFRVSGKIDQRFANVGDHVEPDTVLAHVDAREQVANFDAAMAARGSAMALLTQATATFERQTQLLKGGFTTRQNYDQAQQQLRIEQAAVDSAQAAVGTAHEQLDYASLKAGVAGIITGRNAEVGQVVQAGQTVFTVAQDGPRDAVFDVYESLLTDPPNPHVRVFLQADPKVVTMGMVREVAPTVDPASDTVKVKVALDSVPPGMSLGAVVVGIGAYMPRRAIVLPRSALFRWRDAPAVWVFDPKSRTVNPKIITIDRYVGSKIVLSGGIASGDSVVSAGIQFLYPGQIVDVAQPDQAP